MKLVWTLLLSIALFACQKASPQETPEPEKVAAASTTVVEAPPPAPAECGGQCGGQCGGSCGGQAQPETTGTVPVAWQSPPDGTVWSEMKVTGMHCGGCARRIKNALAQVDGVYGCEIDVATATVKVAVGPGKDARTLAAPRIAALGYRVVE